MKISKWKNGKITLKYSFLPEITFSGVLPQAKEDDMFCYNTIRSKLLMNSFKNQFKQESFKGICCQ